MKNLSDFTNLYSLSKTLRFELKPIDENGNSVTNIGSFLSNILEKDKKIEIAYQVIKPLLDAIYEEIINGSLNSDSAKNINFSAYFEEYLKGKEKKLDAFEKILRETIGKTFEEGVIQLNEKFSKKNKKGETKPLFEIKKNVPEVKAEILDYLKEKYKENVDLQQHLNEIKSFWTYFSNYNTNRANYFEYKKEANTAVATRIVNDNLPKFCDNILLFDKRKQDYENAYQFLKDNNRETQIKDAESGEMTEAVTINRNLFDIKYFNQYLIQTGIENYNKTIGHYNLLINLYNQARRDEEGFNKLNHFKTLYKQIGCGKGKALFFAINNEDELSILLDRIKTNSQTFIANVNSFISWLQEHEQSNDWKGIYWSKAAVDKISNSYLENWHSLKDELKKNKACVHKNSRTKELEFNDAVELSGLFGATIELKEDFKGKSLIELICEDVTVNINGFNDNIDSILAITDYQNDDNKKKIKECLDFILNVIRLIKYFSVKENKIKGESIDSELSNHLSILLKTDDFAITKWYDAIRNYLTKRPQDDVKNQKLKLNFEKGNLLGGFVDSHSENDNGTQYGGYIFRKKNTNNKYEYFLGISKDSKLFRCHEKHNIKNEDKSEYERLDYYQAKSTTYFDDRYSSNKENLIKIIEELVDKVVGYEQDKEKIKKRNKGGEITPSALFERLRKSKIDEFKSILQNKEIVQRATETAEQLQTYCNKFTNSSDTLKNLVDNKTEYIGIDGLTKIIADLQKIATENKVYDFFSVDKNELEKSFKQNKKLYLFKITNKDLKERDLSNTRKSYKDKKLNYNDNLHTLYFKALMREIANSRIDIGKGEIFFRNAINKPKEITHPKNELIFRRSDNMTESRFTHDIIKDNRFYEDKLQLHLSIIINYNPSKRKVDDIINNTYVKENDVLFLGIDRGERNLIYYSLINQKGEVVDNGQGDFNTINGKDYYSAIVKKADDKKKAQKDWGEAVKIQNIKDGYISLVVHEIMEKMRGKPTFIVLEDLNTGFKRGRFCFEQQVYQKFELAIAKKLNYLVYKDVKKGVGSAIEGIQLTPPVTNYQDIEGKKQLGAMLYVRANYTSTTDPVTGWRKTIYLQKGSEEKIKKQILTEFTEIGFDKQDYFFEYTEKHTNKQWKLWSSKDGKSLLRYRFKRGKDKNEGIIESFNLKEMLDSLFVEFDKTKSLKEQLKKKDPAKINEHPAWESLRFVIDLIMQIRNNGDMTKNQDENFLFSPVRNGQNEHFDSREYQKQENPKLPKDADANGAFNIARKGLIAFEHIKQNTKEPDLFISDAEWDLWLLNKDEWRKRLPEFSARKQKKENNDEK